MKDIIQENKGFIRAVIRRVTGAYNEDIEQEVYIKTWRNMQNYQEYLVNQENNKKYYIIPSLLLKNINFKFDKATGHMTLNLLNSVNLE